MVKACRIKARTKKAKKRGFPSKAVNTSPFDNISFTRPASHHISRPPGGNQDSRIDGIENGYASLPFVVMRKKKQVYRNSKADVDEFWKQFKEDAQTDNEEQSEFDACLPKVSLKKKVTDHRDSRVVAEDFWKQFSQEEDSQNEKSEVQTSLLESRTKVNEKTSDKMLDSQMSTGARKDRRISSQEIIPASPTTLTASPSLREHRKLKRRKIRSSTDEQIEWSELLKTYGDRDDTEESSCPNEDISCKNDRMFTSKSENPFKFEISSTDIEKESEADDQNQVNREVQSDEKELGCHSEQAIDNDETTLLHSTFESISSINPVEQIADTAQHCKEQESLVVCRRSRVSSNGSNSRRRSSGIMIRLSQYFNEEDRENEGQNLEDCPSPTTESKSLPVELASSQYVTSTPSEEVTETRGCAEVKDEKEHVTFYAVFHKNQNNPTEESEQHTSIEGHETAENFPQIDERSKTEANLERRPMRRQKKSTNFKLNANDDLLNALDQEHLFVSLAKTKAKKDDSKRFFMDGVNARKLSKQQTPVAKNMTVSKSDKNEVENEYPFGSQSPVDNQASLRVETEFSEEILDNSTLISEQPLQDNVSADVCPEFSKNTTNDPKNVTKSSNGIAEVEVVSKHAENKYLSTKRHSITTSLTFTLKHDSNRHHQSEEEILPVSQRVDSVAEKQGETEKIAPARNEDYFKNHGEAQRAVICKDGSNESLTDSEDANSKIEDASLQDKFYKEEGKEMMEGKGERSITKEVSQDWFKDEGEDTSQNNSEELLKDSLQEREPTSENDSSELEREDSFEEFEMVELDVVSTSIQQEENIKTAKLLLQGVSFDQPNVGSKKPDIELNSDSFVHKDCIQNSSEMDFKLKEEREEIATRIDFEWRSYDVAGEEQSYPDREMVFEWVTRAEVAENNECPIDEDGLEDTDELPISENRDGDKFGDQFTTNEDSGKEIEEAMFSSQISEEKTEESNQVPFSNNLKVRKLSTEIVNFETIDFDNNDSSIIESDKLLLNIDSTATTCTESERDTLASGSHGVILNERGSLLTALHEETLAEKSLVNQKRQLSPMTSVCSDIFYDADTSITGPYKQEIGKSESFDPLKKTSITESSEKKVSIAESFMEKSAKVGSFDRETGCLGESEEKSVMVDLNNNINLQEQNEDVLLDVNNNLQGSISESIQDEETVELDVNDNLDESNKVHPTNDDVLCESPTIEKSSVVQINLEDHQVVRRRRVERIWSLKETDDLTSQSRNESRHSSFKAEEKKYQKKEEKDLSDSSDDSECSYSSLSEYSSENEEEIYSCAENEESAKQVISVNFDDHQITRRRNVERVWDSESENEASNDGDDGVNNVTSSIQVTFDDHQVTRRRNVERIWVSEPEVENISSFNEDKVTKPQKTIVQVNFDDHRVSRRRTVERVWDLESDNEPEEIMPENEIEECELKQESMTEEEEGFYNEQAQISVSESKNEEHDILNVNEDLVQVKNTIQVNLDDHKITRRRNSERILDSEVEEESLNKRDEESKTFGIEAIQAIQVELDDREVERRRTVDRIWCSDEDNEGVFDAGVDLKIEASPDDNKDELQKEESAYKEILKIEIVFEDHEVKRKRKIKPVWDSEASDDNEDLQSNENLHFYEDNKTQDNNSRPPKVIKIEFDDSSIKRKRRTEKLCDSDSERLVDDFKDIFGCSPREEKFDSSEENTSVNQYDVEMSKKELPDKLQFDKVDLPENESEKKIVLNDATITETDDAMDSKQKIEGSEIPGDVREIKDEKQQFDSNDALLNQSKDGKKKVHKERILRRKKNNTNKITTLDDYLEGLDDSNRLARLSKPSQPIKKEKQQDLTTTSGNDVVAETTNDEEYLEIKISSTNKDKNNQTGNENDTTISTDDTKPEQTGKRSDPVASEKGEKSRKELLIESLKSKIKHSVSVGGDLDKKSILKNTLNNSLKRNAASASSLINEETFDTVDHESKRLQSAEESKQKKLQLAAALMKIKSASTSNLTGNPEALKEGSLTDILGLIKEDHKVRQDGRKENQNVEEEKGQQSVEKKKEDQKEQKVNNIGVMENEGALKGEMTALESEKENTTIIDDCALQLSHNSTYLDLEASIEEQDDLLDGFKDSRKNTIILRTQLSVRVHNIIAKLLTATGRDLRRALFSLKQIFQDDKDLVHEFVTNDGLSCLITVGTDADQNYQNYILRAIGQIMLYVDGMNGVIAHNDTIQWLYSLLSSKYRLVQKTSLKLLLVFVEYTESNSLLVWNAACSVDKGGCPMKGIVGILHGTEGDVDEDLLVYSFTLVNKVLYGIPDQDLFYDVVDVLEEQDMESLCQNMQQRTSRNNELVEQCNIYELSIKAEDDEGIVGNVPGGVRQQRRNTTADGRKSRRHSTKPPPTQAPLATTKTPDKDGDNDLMEKRRQMRRERRQKGSTDNLLSTTEDEVQKVKTTAGHINKEMPSKPVHLLQNGHTTTTGVQRGTAQLHAPAQPESPAPQETNSHSRLNMKETFELGERDQSSGRMSLRDRLAERQKQKSLQQNNQVEGDKPAPPEKKEGGAENRRKMLRMMYGQSVDKTDQELADETKKLSVKETLADRKANLHQEKIAEEEAKNKPDLKDDLKGTIESQQVKIKAEKEKQEKEKKEEKSGFLSKMKSVIGAKPEPPKVDNNNNKSGGRPAEEIELESKVLRTRPLIVNEYDFRDLNDTDDYDTLAPPKKQKAGTPGPPGMPGMPPPPPPPPGMGMPPPPPGMGPPPPPPGMGPPPPPPPPGMGAPPPPPPPGGASMAKPKNAGRKFVRLFWQEVKPVALPQGFEKTIWGAISKENVDTKKLEHLFENRVKASMKVAESAQEKPKKEITVLDLKRAQAINIVLTKLPPVRVIKQAILDMDSAVIDKEGIEKIMVMVPTDEEKTKLQEAQMASPDVPFAHAESFLNILSSISELSARLNLWSFKMDYETNEKEIGEALSDLKCITQEVRESDTLKKVLGLLLSIGNFLNGVNIKGFQLQYLEKVPEVKDTVHKQTLLFHVCTMIMEKYPDSSDLYSEFGAIHRTSRRDYDSLDAMLRKVDDQCKKSWEYLRLIAKHDSSSPLKQKLTDFLGDVGERIALLKVINRRVRNRFCKLLQFLGMSHRNAKEQKAEVFAKIISEFSLEYRTVRQRVLETKKRKENNRKRTKTRGKLITESENFAGTTSVPVATGKLDPKTKGEETMDLLSKAITGGDDASNPTKGRVRGKKPVKSPACDKKLNTSSPGTNGGGNASNCDTDDQTDQMMDMLVKSATDSERKTRIRRNRAKDSNSTRKSARRTRTLNNGLTVEQLQDMQS